MTREGKGETYNVTNNQFTGQDFLLLTVTDNDSAHGDVTLERRDDVGSLLLLVPTDQGVQQQDTTDHTQINPVTQTSSEQNSQFHDCEKAQTR